MEKINQLTKDQKNQIPIFVGKWVERGLATDQLELGEYRKIIENFNREIYKSKPISIHAPPLARFGAALDVSQTICGTTAFNPTVLFEYNEKIKSI